jgi:L-ascorbate metabolism protein UlaG (beta-lactamase superfamily)
MRTPALAALTLAVAAAAVAATSAGPALAQSNCQAVAAAPSLVRVASADPHGAFRLAAVEPDHVAVTYVGHATFRIEAADGTVVATDYAGWAGAGKTPDVVTMNHAHSSHFTTVPDPAIAHVLPGWGDFGQGIRHHVTVGEILVRNVPTDIRRFGTVEESGNSIFIVEVAGLCLGHLGHLHQTLSDAQVAEIGRLDVVFVPIDGTYTMDQAAMMDVVRRLRAQVVVPMHWFSSYSLAEFVAATRAAGLAVDERTDPTLTLSLNTLPETPTLVVLPRGGRDG